MPASSCHLAQGQMTRIQHQHDMQYLRPASGQTLPCHKTTKRQQGMQILGIKAAGHAKAQNLCSNLHTRHTCRSWGSKQYSRQAHQFFSAGPQRTHKSRCTATLAVEPHPYMPSHSCLSFFKRSRSFATASARPSVVRTTGYACTNTYT